MSEYLPIWRKVLALPSKLQGRLRQRGLGECVDWCGYQLAWRWREWRMGIDTREFAHGVVVEDQGSCHGYEPIDHRCFDIVLDSLGDPAGQVFVDYGCGLGRAVVLAACRPFDRVIGVEYNAGLAELARQQVEKARSRGFFPCPRVEIVEADAAQWQVPEEVTCVFLFNSFRDELLSAVLEQIRCSLVRQPRALKLVYVQPVSDYDTLQDCPWLTRSRLLPTGFWTHVRAVIYESAMQP